ncbi:MAG: alpha/beta hydrolase [Bacteroidales bacterium]|jgi:pimeloyl-ACP methyl ester carboxylesterase|nr:alpha/beta hydrolase [Bacteroidales bacterium]
MKKCFSLLAALSLSLWACNKSDNGGAEKDTPLQTGVSAELVRTVTATELKQLSAVAGIENFISGDVKIWKAEYNTSCKGEAVRASGVFVLPATVRPTVPTVVYCHGTVSRNGEPSYTATTNIGSEVGLASAIAAVFNCAVIAPDYIGYGVSAAVKHPYVHGETLGNATLDFIRAYIEHSEKTLNTTVSREVVCVGYSEGGYAAVALHKAIQAAESGIHVRKTYAGAGPYDQENFIREMLTHDSDLAANHLSSYLWVLSVYKDYMGYSRPYDRIYSEADNAIFSQGSYDFGYMKEYSGINRNPQQLFRADFAAEIENGADTELLTIVRQNSLVSFVPTDSLILFHSEADSWVYVSNTNSAYSAMKSAGAPVRRVIVPQSEHKDHSAAAADFLEFAFRNAMSTGAIAGN